MATRKSSTAQQEYVTVPLEERVRHLEKRHRQSERTRAWQRSTAYKLTVAATIYLTASMLLIMMLIPGWYVCALVPTVGYGLGQLALKLVRDVWEATPHKK